MEKKFLNCELFISFWLLALEQTNGTIPLSYPPISNILGFKDVFNFIV